MSFPIKRPVWRPRIEISKKKMDDFSSKTACVTTQKMKISEEILDEFEICFIDRFKSLLLHNHILRVQSMLVTDVEDKICLLIITYWT